MNRLRCLVVDDKPLAIDVLSDYARQIPFLDLVATTTNPIEGLNIVSGRNIDVVFLDIQMPGLTGLQFINIAGKQCMTILTTAYAEYALDGYDYNVVDYLLKPIAFERFYKAAEKAYHLFQSKRAGLPPVQNMEAAGQSFRPAEFLFVKTEHRIQKINLRDILYVEALQNYVSLNTIPGRVMSLQPLKKIEEQLPITEFVRVHKSYIVSLRHINSVERSRIFIGDTIIPVGDNYRDSFYRMIDRP